LNRVGTGLVEGFAAGYILRDFGFREGSEAHLRGGMIDDDAVAVTKTDTGDDSVLAAGKQAQHGAGVIRVHGFFENVVINRDGGVGAQHDFIGAFPGGFGFGGRQATDVVNRTFARSAHFFHGFRAHGEMESGERQQLATAGRLRC